MANLALFSIRVKGGTKKSLEKFFDSQSMSECFNCEYKSINNNNYLFFNGECKWGINTKQNQPIKDGKSLDNYSIEELENYSLQDKSKIFNCEIEAFEYAEDADGIANHYRYKDGKIIIDEEVDLRDNTSIKYISDKDADGNEYDFWEVDFEKAFKLGTKNEEEIVKEQKELDTELVDNDINNFDIKDGTLVRYSGQGGTVLIPEGVESINEYAFYKNNNVKKIVLPSSLKEISDYCFNSMKNLEKIKLPNPFIPIGEDAFDESNKSKLFVDDLLIIGNVLLWSRADKEIITIPDNVEVIREGAFQYKKELKKVILPKKVYYICESAFLNCENLEDINISNTVKYIGKSCFKNCKKLKKFELANDTVVDYMAFFNCENFKDCDNFIINNNVIENYFGNDTNVVIPDNIVEIGEEAFMDNNSIQTIKIPNSVVKIGASAFQNCVNLREINIPNNVSLLGKKCFNKSGISKVTISNSLVEIPTSCFECCDKLLEIVLPDNIKSLGYGAFCGCHQLKDVTLSNNLELIGNSCFHGCSSLENVDIPSSVKKIDQYAFLDCVSLSNIKMDKDKIEIDESSFNGTQIQS